MKSKYGLKRIFSRRIALMLIDLGFEPVRTEPHEKMQGFVTYLFDNTKEFKEALTKLSNK